MTTPPIAIRWIGGPTADIRLGSIRVLTDPVLGDGPETFRFALHPSTGQADVPVGRLVPVPPLDLRGIDVVLLSHLHTDHFDDAAAHALPKDAHVIAPPSQLEMVRAKGFTHTTSLDWWQSTNIARADSTLQITAVPARHATDDAVNARLGFVNGYLLRYGAAGKTFIAYWTGDTVWFPELERIAAAARPVDVVLAHAGAVGAGGPFGLLTLDAQLAARLNALFHPRAFIPIHHHSFAHYTQPATEIVAASSPGAAGRIVILAEGETWVDPGVHPPRGRISVE